MFVKLVRSANPPDVCLLECVSARIIVRILEHDEETASDWVDWDRHEVTGSADPPYIPFGLPERVAKGTKVVKVKLEGPNVVSSTVMANNVDVYLMTDDGKTIDKC